MKKKLISSVLVGAMGLASIAGCSVADPSADSTPNQAAENKDPVSISKEISSISQSQMTALRNGYLKFTFDLINKCQETGGNDKNVMVSPASVMLALDMTAAGAKDETLRQMTGLFGGADDPQSQLSYAANLMQRLNNAEGVDMSAANSIWVNNQIIKEKLSKDYTDFVGEYFDAYAEYTMFDMAATNKLNGWVNDKTKGMIPTIIDELKPDMAMVLVNAIAFDAKWAKQYETDNVVEGTFTSTAGEEQTVDMMHGTEETYLENDLATGFVKYYEGDQYAFVVMLPKDKNQSAGEMLASFTGEEFDNFMSSATTEYLVRTRLPRFSYDWDSSIVPQLQALGMEAPFDGSRADFSAMTDSDNGLYIGDVLHKTHIDVDSEGTKAAAVTAVIMYKNSIDVVSQETKDVFCDRSFAYAIVDMTDNTPVFIGTLNSVDK